MIRNTLATVSRLFAIAPRVRLCSTLQTQVTQQGEKDILYRKLNIEVRAHDRKVLDSYETFFLTACKHLQLPVQSSWKNERPLLRRWTVLRSAHIFKKHRTQYETRTHYRGWCLPRLTGSTASTLLEYTQRNLPEGCAMSVEKYELRALPQNISDTLK